jgi:hypothetical protein
MIWLAYTPFVQPPPIWGAWYQLALALPICAALSIVYKSVRCGEMKRVPREATVIFITIVVGMVLAAAVLMLLVKLMV